MGVVSTQSLLYILNGKRYSGKSEAVSFGREFGDTSWSATHNKLNSIKDLRDSRLVALMFHVRKIPVSESGSSRDRLHLAPAVGLTLTTQPRFQTTELAVGPVPYVISDRIEEPIEARGVLGNHKEEANEGEEPQGSDEEFVRQGSEGANQPLEDVFALHGNGEHEEVKDAEEEVEA